MSVVEVQLRRVVVTGLGLVTPIGVGVKHAWRNLLEGFSGVRKIEGDELGYPEKHWTQLPSRIASLVPKGSSADSGCYNPKQFSSSEDRVLSLGMKYGMVAAEEALRDAKWHTNQDLDVMQRSGVAIGMAMVDTDFISHSDRLVCDNQYKKLGPYYVPRILTNLGAGHISIKHGLMGPNHSVATACATGSHAIGDAYRFIQLGDADVMVCGGTEACVTPVNVAGFCRARALSTKYNDNPTVASRPFDRDRDGFVIGEGAGILVLEELEHALARGANIYAEVVGYGLSGDSHHITAGRKDGLGALLAMRKAFKGIGLVKGIHNLWCINAHATSTPLGDLAEVTAMKKLISDFKGVNPYISSNKGHIGHLLGAAGSVESVFAILGLKNRIVPKTLNLKQLEDCDELNFVKGENVQDQNPSLNQRLVLKNSFGFGGTNCSLLFSNFIE